MAGHSDEGAGGGVTDYEDFDLDRSTEAAWREFTSRLGEVVSMMDDSGALTIGCLAREDAEAPFVRLHCTADRRIIGEAASNANLSDEYQLTLTQLARLHDLGWHDPGVDGEFATGNFWRTCPQEQADTIAGHTVTALREVYGVQHPVFLAPDQLAEVLQSKPTPVELAEFDAEDVVAVLARDKAHLDSLVDAELTDIFGHEPIRDHEGDVAIRVGSAMLFLRSTLDCKEIIVFSPLVHDVEGRSRAVEVLNDLNAEARWVRFQLIRDRVFVSMSVLAKPFVAAHLQQAVRAVSDVADGIDEHLAERLRGRTSFPS